MTKDSKSLGDIMKANMKDHDIQIPIPKTSFKVPEAQKVLKAAMQMILEPENKDLIWIPEYDKVAEWLSDNKGRGIFMYGDCGLGKSVLGRYAIPMLLLHFCNKVVRVFSTKEMNENLDEILKMNFISLDDIGTEEISNSYGNRRQAFAEIMDEAEKKSKILIISTNLTKTQLDQKYGTRVFERIISTTERVNFTGKSFRK